MYYILLLIHFVLCHESINICPYKQSINSISKRELILTPESINKDHFCDIDSFFDVSFANGPGSSKKVTTIPNQLFYRCNIGKLTISNEITKIGIASFYECTINEIEFQPTSKLTNISEDAFYSTTFGRSFQLPNSIQFIGNSAFAECNTLKINGNITAQIIDDDAFKNCHQLEISNINIISPGRIGHGSFLNCSKLNCCLTFFSNKSTESLSIIDKSAFQNSGIQKVNFENVAKISQKAFQECNNLKGHLHFPETLKFIGQYAFYKSVNFISSITFDFKKLTIGKSAFDGCNGLIIPIIKFNDLYSDDDEKDPMFITILSDRLHVNQNAFNGIYFNRVECKSNNQSSFYDFEKKDSIDESTKKLYKCGENVFYSFYNHTLKIFGFGPMNNYSRKDIKPWTILEIVFKIEQLLINENVTFIGNYSFYNCASIITMSITSSVISVGDMAFGFCNAIEYIDLRDGITLADRYSFLGQFYLKSVVVYPNNTKYQSIDGVLFTKDGKKLIYYPPKKDTKSYVIPFNITSISDCLFYNCKKLISVAIPDSVTSIGNRAFENCLSLTSIKIPENVEKIGNKAFFGCESLVNVTISKSVKFIGNSAFSFCKSLLSITIPNNVEFINEYTFYNCKSLINATIQNGVKSIGKCSFYQCKSLALVSISDTVSSIGQQSFFECYSLSSINIPNGIKIIEYCTFGYCESLPSIVIPNSVTVIGNFSFENCLKLKSVNIPNSVKSICDSAFEYCKSLLSVVIPNGVISIGNKSFCNCGSLESVIIANSVVSIGDYAFVTCNSLKYIHIPDSVTKIGKHAFDSCYGLQLVEVSPNNKNYKSIDGVLYSKNGKELIYYPNNKTKTEYKIPEGVESIANFTISENKNINYVHIPDSVTFIGFFVFQFCDNLKSINVSPNNKKFKSIDGVLLCKDGRELICYPNGKKLANYKVPEGVESIRKYAFFLCHNLQSVTFPEGIKSLGKKIFYRCFYLTNVNLPDSLIHIDEYAFDETPLIRNYEFRNRLNNFKKSKKKMMSFKYFQ